MAAAGRNGADRGQGHLPPFLPRSPPRRAARPGRCSASAYVSASILPIIYAYIRLMGGERESRGRRRSRSSNANYIARRCWRRLSPVLFKGKGGAVAHRMHSRHPPLCQMAGHVTSTDIAKRLMDCGIPRADMSLARRGTLMVEPTEASQGRARTGFCDAMLAIRRGIAAVGTRRDARRAQPPCAWRPTRWRT